MSSRRGGGLADRRGRPAPLRLRPGARAHRPPRQRADRARHQAWRPRGDAGLERLPPLRALLRHRRHRRRLPHHQPAAVPRADHLHRQPRRGHGAVLRPDLPAAGGEAGSRAQDRAHLRADDGSRAHAGQRASCRACSATRACWPRCRPAIDWPEFDENAACALCYTSGTTGEPKGALYSNRSMVLHTFFTHRPQPHSVRLQPHASCPWCRCSMPTPGACPTSRR